MSHLISFAVVLCIFVVSSVSVSTNESNKASKSNSSLDYEGSAEFESTTSTITFTTISLNPSIIHETHSDHYDKDTDSEHLEGNTTGYTTTMGSTMTTESTTGKTTAGVQTNSAGIVFLIFILFIIIILAIILYFLWRKGKRYSFDLTNCEHDTPLRSIEHTGTIEPIKGSTINLDSNAENNSTTISPVPNGCPGETPEKTLSSEQRRVSEGNSSGSDLSLNLPVKKVEFNLDLELIGGDAEAAKEAPDEPVDNNNENNNNDSNAGSDSAELFTEINLDDMQ